MYQTIANFPLPSYPLKRRGWKNWVQKYTRIYSMSLLRFSKIYTCIYLDFEGPKRWTPRHGMRVWYVSDKCCIICMYGTEITVGRYGVVLCISRRGSEYHIFISLSQKLMPTKGNHWYEGSPFVWYWSHLIDCHTAASNLNARKLCWSWEYCYSGIFPIR